MESVFQNASFKNHLDVYPEVLKKMGIWRSFIRTMIVSLCWLVFITFVGSNPIRSKTVLLFQCLSLICKKKFFNNFRTLWILLFDWYQIKLRNFYDPVGEKIRRDFANFIIKKIAAEQTNCSMYPLFKNRLQVKSHLDDKWEICMFKS